MSATLYFIRHGESVANTEHFFAGSTDVPLTTLGETQIRLTADYLRDIPFSAIYASDLCRAVNTAKPIAEDHRLPIHIEPDLREIFAGDWEKLPFDKLLKEPAYALWLTDLGKAACPGGETCAALAKRVLAASQRIASRHPGENVCIATHATPIRLLQCYWHGLSLSEAKLFSWVPNASVSAVTYEDNGTYHILLEGYADFLGELKTSLPPNV